MAGNLGGLPTVGELIERFEKKGVTLTVPQAQQIHDAVAEHLRNRGKSSTRAPKAQKPQTEPQPKPEPKREVAKTTRSWGK